MELNISHPNLKEPDKIGGYYNSYYIELSGHLISKL